MPIPVKVWHLQSKATMKMKESTSILPLLNGIDFDRWCTQAPTTEGEDSPEAGGLGEVALPSQSQSRPQLV